MNQPRSWSPFGAPLAGAILLITVLGCAENGGPKLDPVKMSALAPKMQELVDRHEIAGAVTLVARCCRRGNAFAREAGVTRFKLGNARPIVRSGHRWQAGSASRNRWQEMVGSWPLRV